MNPQFELDLTRSVDPIIGRKGRHGDLSRPECAPDPRRGLAFPLASGGLVFASKGALHDDAGTLEVRFTPKTARPEGALIQGWGQYEPLLHLSGERLQAMLYGHKMEICVRWKEGTEYTVRLSWDNTAGATLSLQSGRGRPQALRHRMVWKAFRQEYVPFGIGGQATEPRYRKWAGGFQGWIRSVRTWAQPMDVPGPVQLEVGGEPVRPPFRPSAKVKVLSLDDAPIRPDPLGLVQLPDRLADLRRTREAGGLDEVVAHCKTELETFAMLTWHIGMMWPHCNYWPWPKEEQRWIFWKRGHEMLPDLSAGRMGGMCGGYAHVMEEVFWSMGFDARRIQVRGHSSFEAYSNEQDRWIICDASWHTKCHLLSDGHGRFLGCGDIIRRHEALEHNPAALESIRVMNCQRENLADIGPAVATTGGGLNSAYCYDNIGVSVDKTAEYGREGSSAHGLIRMAHYLMPHDRAAFNPAGMGHGGEARLVNNLYDLYPSRNRVKASLAWKQRDTVLEARLTPVGVTFPDGILVSIDDGPERRATGGRFTWKLHAGVNHLSARTRNRLGAMGHPWRISVWQQP